MKCVYCHRERDLKKHNITNWNRHVNSCKLKYKGCSKTLDKFFTKKKLDASGNCISF